MGERKAFRSRPTLLYVYQGMYNRPSNLLGCLRIARVLILYTYQVSSNMFFERIETHCCYQQEHPLLIFLKNIDEDEVSVILSWCRPARVGACSSDGTNIQV